MPSLIGIYGILGKDECTQNLTVIFTKRLVDSFSAFDVILGADIIFLGIILILFMFIICFYNFREDKCANCYRALVCLIIIFLILFVITSLVLVPYAFGITRPIYVLYNIWKREFINCSSPVLYIAFVYLTIQYTAFVLIVIGVIAGFIIKHSINIFCPST